MNTNPNFGGFDAFTGEPNTANGGVMLRFYTRTVKDEPASEQAGRPVYKDVAYIKLMTPGDPFNQPDRPVRESDKTQYPVPWAAYQKSLTEVHNGLALEQWPGCTRAQVEDLKYRGVFTVEELAQLSEADASTLDVGALREKARDYVSRDTVDDDRARMRDTITAKDGEIAMLRQQLADAARERSDSKKKDKG